MTDEKRPAGAESATGGKQSSGPRITRRRFTKAGAAAPFIMTLAGRPVWGADCLTVSAGASGEASSARAAGGGLAAGTQGHSVNYWLTHPSNWLAERNVVTYTVEKPDSLKGLVVTIVKPDSEGLHGHLSRGADDKHAQLAAAKLNARKLEDFGYSEAEIDELNLDDPYALEFLICLNGRSLDKDDVSLLEISKVRMPKADTSASPTTQAVMKSSEPATDASVKDNKCIDVTGVPFIQVSGDLGQIAAYAVSDSGLEYAVERNCKGD
jgi:hypothetical protein